MSLNAAGKDVGLGHRGPQRHRLSRVSQEGCKATLQSHTARGHGLGGAAAPALSSALPVPHSYNPFDGPNENPEAELPLTAGKYLYVYGDMDEDGFYEGMLYLMHQFMLIHAD